VENATPQNSICMAPAKNGLASMQKSKNLPSRPKVPPTLSGARPSNHAGGAARLNQTTAHPLQAALPAPFSYTHRPVCSVAHEPAGSWVGNATPRNSIRMAPAKDGLASMQKSNNLPSRPHFRRAAPGRPSQPTYPTPASPNAPTLHLAQPNLPYTVPYTSQATYPTPSSYLPNQLTLLPPPGHLPYTALYNSLPMLIITWHPRSTKLDFASYTTVQGRERG
jgi:hypothetical protein